LRETDIDGYSKEYDKVIDALEKIERSKNSQFEHHLIELLDSNLCTHEQIRRCTINALGQIGGDNSVGILIRELNNPHADVNSVAAFSLGKLQDRKSISNEPQIKEIVFALKKYLMDDIRGNDQVMMAAWSLSLFKKHVEVNDILMDVCIIYQNEDIEVVDYLKSLMD